jgi:hypothetical protein
MTRAKAQGKHVGRPRIPAQKEVAIRRDILAARSLRSTTKAHGVGSKTVQRIKAELADQTSASHGRDRHRCPVIPTLPSSAVPAQYFSS